MTERWDFAPACAAEFPNDNPALHVGATWACLGVTGPLRPIVRARQRPVVSEVVSLVAASQPEKPVTAEPPAVEERTPGLERDPITVSVQPTVEEVPANDVVALAAAPPSVRAAGSEDASSEGHDILRPNEEPTTDPVSERAPTNEAAEMNDVPGMAAASIEPITDLENAPSNPTSYKEASDSVAATGQAEAATELATDSTASGGNPSIDDGVAVSTESTEAATELARDPTASSDNRSVEGNCPVAATARSIESATEPIPELDATGPVVIPVPIPDAIPAPDPYEAFVGALTAVAMANGASRGAALLTTLLDGAGDLRGIPDETRENLTRAEVLDSSGGRMSEAFVATANAWRQVLRNESSDFSACGTATLDVWGADLLRSLGVDAGIDVRKELRRRGVAAFGMRVAA